MQRFKEKMQASYADREEVYLHISDSKGRFAYGANGTLTQAARWRKQAVVRIDELHEVEHFAHRALRRSCIASLLDSAKRGGCYLP